MTYTNVFSSFSTSDMDATEAFYRDTVGLTVNKLEEMGLLEISLDATHSIMVYPKDDHQPAVFTVLNLVVSDVVVARDELAGKGVEFDNFGMNVDDQGMPTNEHGGPRVTWFRDPAGNIVALMEE